MPEIQSLNDHVSQLSQDVAWWNSAMIWALVFAAIAAVAVVVTTRVALGRAKQLADAQDRLMQTKEKQLTLDLKEKDEKILWLQKQASDAKATQQKVEIDLSRQQERTAAAETRLLALQMQHLPRLLKFKNQEDIDHTVELLSRAPCAAEILYRADDAEAHQLADWIFAMLKPAGWHVSPPGPIPNGIAGNAVEQLGAQPLGVTITVKNLLDNPKRDDPYSVLRDTLSRSLGQIYGGRNVSLPENFLRVVVMPRP